MTMWLLARAQGGIIYYTIQRETLNTRSLQEILASEESGTNTSGNGKTVVIEFSSPNIAKHIVSSTLCHSYALFSFSCWASSKHDHRKFTVKLVRSQWVESRTSELVHFSI
jgi:hypothetical protein